MNISYFEIIITNMYEKQKKFIYSLLLLIVPYYRRIIRFIALPYCYFFLVNWNECNKSKLQVIKDFYYIFFELKYFPDNYSPCRLFEKDRNIWSYYYGSNYDPYQRAKLRKIQPKDYEIIFEDKEVCMQLCLGMSFPLPKTLRVVDPEDNYREDIAKIMNDNINKQFIIKPVLGSAGRNIVKVFMEDNQIFVKTKDNIFILDKFVLSERSLVQEIVLQNPIISEISEVSINTIRVLTLMTKSNDVIILGSTMRFGVGNSHIDNWSAGGIAVGVNIDNGTLMSIAYDKKGNQYTFHPVSKIVFKGFILPMWNEVKELAISVQKQFPYYKLLGLDIAISNDGPILIEINAFPDFVFQEQTSGPLLLNENNLKEFKEYDLLINNYQNKI